MLKVTGIVLRRRDSGEADRRLTLLTKEDGKIDVIAKGARKGGSRLAASSEPLTISEYELALGKVNRFVTQAQPLTSFPGLRNDFDRLQTGLALMEIAAAVSSPGLSSEHSFHLLWRSLCLLEAHPSPVVAFLWTGVQWLDLEGQLPSWTVSGSDGLPIQENPAWIAPSAGGLVAKGEEIEHSDRFQVSAEALLGLDALNGLDSPPDRIKRSSECLSALIPFLENIAHQPLPACRALMSETMLNGAS